MKPEQPTPTQLVEQATFQPANMPPEFNLAQDMVQASVALRLATLLVAAQKDLAKWKGREPEIYQHKETRRRAVITSCEIDGGNDSGEPMDVIDKCIKNLRQQLADKTRECEELDVIRKIILDHIGYATVTQNTIKEIIAENAELKKDKERLDLFSKTALDEKQRALMGRILNRTLQPPYPSLRTAIDAERKEQDIMRILYLILATYLTGRSLCPPFELINALCLVMGAVHWNNYYNARKEQS